MTEWTEDRLDREADAVAERYVRTLFDGAWADEGGFVVDYERAGRLLAERLLAEAGEPDFVEAFKRGMTV